MKEDKISGMTKTQFKNKVSLLLKQEANDPVEWWLLSFYGIENKFLGASLHRATGIIGASLKAHQSGSNPGGQVSATCPELGDQVDDKWIGRLLDKDEVKELLKTYLNN